MQASNREFLRFCAVGSLGFVVDAGLLQVLAGRFGMDPYASRGISFLVAATVTWQLNRCYTFSAAAAARGYRQWGRYVAVNAVGGGLNYLTYALGVMQVDMVRRYLFLGVATGSAVGLLVNYTASKYLVFRLVGHR